MWHTQEDAFSGADVKLEDTLETKRAAEPVTLGSLHLNQGCMFNTQIAGHNPRPGQQSTGTAPGNLRFK